MLPNNIESFVAHQAINYIKARDEELNTLKDLLSLYLYKCANFDVKCKMYIQKDNSFGPHVTTDYIDTDDHEKCDICSLNICNKCCNSNKSDYNIAYTKRNEEKELNVYDICDLCYSTMCFNCINTNMLFCNDCKLACICKKCFIKKEVINQWTCKYCSDHPRWWEGLPELPELPSTN